MKQRFLTALLTALFGVCAFSAHAADPAAVPAAAAPASCDALRAQIEAKIGAAGVNRFTVTVVDAQAEVEGQVVGSCELGTKKVVYQRLDAGGASTPTPSPARTGEAPILTECKDGSTSVGGDCKR